MRHVSVSFLCMVSAGLSQELTCSDVVNQLSCGDEYDSMNSCGNVGCCWDSSSNACYFGPVSGYSVAALSMEGSASTASLDLLSPSGSAFGSDLNSLEFYVNMETPTRLYMKLADSVSSSNRWSVPSSIIPRPGGTVGQSNLSYSISQNPFSVDVIRIGNDQPVFTLQSEVVFKDQYIQISLETPSGSAIYGLGENTRTQQRIQDGDVIPLWNADVGAFNYGVNLYGSHAFYLQLVDYGGVMSAHGVYLLNSNAMSVSLTGNTISYQITGGIVELYVFSGPTPEKVISQYLEVIGMPKMPPYWSLGFHNCRYGYPTVDYIQDVVTNYSNAEIPLETQWADIDYMDVWKDFTLDPVNFPLTEMQNLVNSLHDDFQHFVPIIDPGILYAPDGGYPAYDNGIVDDVFIRDMTGNEYYLGQVWPGPTYFPDWFHPNASDYWYQELIDFYELLSYDGIWIDMNEIANFCNMDGQAQICSVPNNETICPIPGHQTTCCLDCTLVNASNSFDFPPYNPPAYYSTLGGKTIAMSSLHYPDVVEYNAHNLYGLMESEATTSALEDIRPNQRGFTLSRSTFPSSGKHAFHWTGDNWSSFDDLRASIVTISSFNMFGVPMTGADICGFAGDTTEQLCQRWIEVGAFYPFSRDHNAIDSIPQELYRWDSVAAAGRTYLNIRYQLMPYLYTLMFLAHTTGRPVFKSLWMNFFDDSNTWDINEQFMWGDGILFSPVLYEDTITVTAYFPSSIWFDFQDGFSAINTIDKPVNKNLPTAYGYTNIHIRGGVIIPMQVPAMTLSQVASSSYSLLVALDPTFGAVGSVVLDDGEQLEIDPSVSGSQTTVISYNCYNQALTAVYTYDDYEGASDLTLENITIVGESNMPKGCMNLVWSSQVTHQTNTRFLYEQDGYETSVAPDGVTNIITVTSLAIPMDAVITLTWDKCLDGNDDDDNSEQLSGGAIAGISIGAVVGFAALAFCGYFAWTRTRSRGMLDDDLKPLGSTYYYRSS